MLKMLEMTYISGLQISKPFWGVCPQTTLVMRSMSATHVAFGRGCPPLIYYLTERSLFKKHTTKRGGGGAEAATPAKLKSWANYKRKLGKTMGELGK